MRLAHRGDRQLHRPGRRLVSYSFDHSFWGDLEVRLIAPNGATALIRPRTGGSSAGTETQRLFRLDLNGAPVAGTWILRVNDVASSDTGTVLDFQVTPHYLGGEPPIALTSAYESAVRDLGSGIVAFTRVSWVERLPAGANVIAKLRTCEAAAACATEPWGAELSDPAGGNPGAPARRFAQYRVELSSNGDRPPAVDEISVEYLVNP